MSLLEAAQALSQGEDPAQVFAVLLEGMRRLTSPDAAAVLLRGPDGRLRIVAQQGLCPAAAGVHFDPAAHSRLRAGLSAAMPLRFDRGQEPDPYEGLLDRPGAVLSPIHACAVAPIRSGVEVVGLLTVDAMDPRGLDALKNEDLALAAALAGAACQQERLRDEWLSSHSPPGKRPAVGTVQECIGRSAAMLRLQREIDLLSSLPLPVLILGETGVGKELVARALHGRSPRAAMPFGVINCAALPPSLLEAELFGHARCAFTGAGAARPGRFAAAAGGTLLLDEIGELPVTAQAALLRVLETGEIQRLGEDRTRSVEVRILAATHRPLEQEVAAGRFRADLYHRLVVYPLRVPPLRERRDDIPALVAHFGRAFAGALGAQLAEVSPAVLERLCAYPWPGNVRELKHTVERALLGDLVRQQEEHRSRPRVLQLRLEACGLPGAAERGPSPGSLAATLEEVRRQALAAALARSQGNVAEAARQLGLSRSFAYKEAMRLGLLPRRR